MHEFRRVGLILKYHGNHERFLFALFVGKETVAHFIPGLWNHTSMYFSDSTCMSFPVLYVIRVASFQEISCIWECCKERH